MESSMDAYKLTHQTAGQWKFAMTQGTQTGALSQPRGVGKGGKWEVGGRLKREKTDVHLWLIHADVWQKSNQYRKAIIN